MASPFKVTEGHAKALFFATYLTPGPQKGLEPLADARGSKCRFFAKIQPEVILKRLGAEGRGTRNFGFFLCPPLPFVVSSETAS